MTTSVIPPGMTKCLTCDLLHSGDGCPACKPAFRLTLYGISGKVQAVYEFEPDFLATDGVQPLVIDPRPVFTVTRIVVEPVVEQLELESGL